MYAYLTTERQHANNTHTRGESDTARKDSQQRVGSASANKGPTTVAWKGGARGLLHSAHEVG